MGAVGAMQDLNKGAARRRVLLRRDSVGVVGHQAAQMSRTSSKGGKALRRPLLSVRPCPGTAIVGSSAWGPGACLLDRPPHTAPGAATLHSLPQEVGCARRSVAQICAVPEA